MKKKILAGLLASLMLLSVLVSCGDTPALNNEENTTAAPAAGTTAAPAEETTAPETVPENQIDSLPEKKEFNDKFVILSRKNTASELESSETTGDIVVDAVTERNLAVEERLGVTIEVISIPGDWSDKNEYIAAVRNSVGSGTSEYDMLSTHSAYIVDIGLGGLGYNMAELDPIDFSKKWWSKVYAENVNINGMVFSAVGDINYTLYEYMMAMFVNKKIAADFSITDIYDSVLDGTWTYEKMMTNVRKVSDDANGDQTPNQGDIFGLGFGGHTARMCATVWDTKMTVKNSDGVQELNLPNEKYIDVYNRLYDCVNNNKQNVFFNDNINTIVGEFAAEHLLYLSERLGAAASMKEMTSEYGIIPFPKYDENQLQYISSSRDYMSAIAVPANIDNPEMVGTVIEAMCMYGFQKITPPYYEITLKYRYLSDPIAVQILDLIRDNLRHDFGMTFTNSISLIYSVMGDNLKNGVRDVSVTLSGSVKAWKKNIKNIYETYEKLQK